MAGIGTYHRSYSAKRVRIAHRALAKTSCRSNVNRQYPESVPLALFVPIIVAGVSALALQLTNVFWLAVAWPHLVALVWWVVLSFVIFLRYMHSSGSGS